MAKKPTTAGKIRAFFSVHPNASVVDAAGALGISGKYIHQIKWLDRKNKRKAKPIDIDAAHSKATKSAPLTLLPLSTSKPDMVNRPPHYTSGGVETIDFIEAKKLSYNLGNVVKYITRADLKGDKFQDLLKAQWYLEREIFRVGNTTRSARGLPTDARQ